MRKFKKTLRKAFLFGGVLIPEHAGYKSDGRINQGLCGNLAAGQDKVAKADLLHAVMIDDALIDCDADELSRVFNAIQVIKEERKAAA